jgi:uncharacterized RDD family membrane protein YckC
MADEQYAAARERLERDYIAGAIDAEEYMRLRRQLEETPSWAEPETEPAPELEPERGWEPMPPLPASGAQPTAHGADPVTSRPLASWGRRAGGWFLDLLVYFVALVVATLATLPSEDPDTGEISDAAAGLIVIVWLFGPILYAWLMVGRWGQTLGKMAVGIKVVRSDDGGRVAYARALGRAASVWLLGLFVIPLFLAYLWPLWDRRNQTIYDKMAGTIVVREGSTPTHPPTQ